MPSVRLVCLCARFDLLELLIIGPRPLMPLNSVTKRTVRQDKITLADESV